MKEYKCKNCGGTINPVTGVCEYCSSRYEIQNENAIRIETFQNPIRVYKSHIDIPDEAMKADVEEMSKIAVKCLSRNLAEAVAANMEMHIERDPMLMSQRITARVRIVDPKFTF